MPEKTEVWRTADGECFFNEADALAHEAIKAQEQELEAFLDENFPVAPGKKTGPARGIAKKAILMWIARAASR